jgi:Terminase large subunit, T4likevirus-type, N-terminal
MSSKVEKTQEVLKLKERIKEEYKRCLDDPLYFMKKYVKIQHQTRGIIPFELYEFQEEALKSIINSERTIILKSRQMGISTLVAAYALWAMVFHEGKNVLVLSITQSTAKEIITKIQLANKELPSWLRQQTLEDNRLSLKFKNLSRVLAASSSSDSTRGFAANLLIIDECAFIQNAEEIWTSAQQTLSTSNGRAILLSTPNGTGNFFYKTWADAESKKNTFKTIKLKWDLHPERNQDWRDEQTRELGEKKAAQECDCEYLTTGDTVVSQLLIKKYRDFRAKDPIETRGRTNDTWIWDYPEDGKNYIVSADCAGGDGKDYSAFHVLDVDTLTQVAEYQGLIGTKDFGNAIVNIATEYNNALAIVEKNNMGYAVLQQIIDRKYDNTFYSSADLKYVDIQRQMTTKFYQREKRLEPGFNTTQATKPLIVNKLETYFREEAIDIRSIRLLNELTTFVWNSSGVAGALHGYNDDLCMSLAIGLWVRDTALRLLNEGVLVSRTMLDGFKKAEPFGNKIYTPKSITSQEAWKMQIGNGHSSKKEDLKWLL